MTKSLFMCLALLCTIGVQQVSAAEVASKKNSTLLINLETNEKPLDIVLQWISRRAGINIVSNEPDQPLVTMRLVNVTWEEAIEQIAVRYDMVIEKRSERIWELTRPPRVRMEFRNAQLGVVLEALARQAGVNIVISDSIDSNRRLTMNLNGVPWQTALDVIVRATGYAWTEHDYRIVRIISSDAVEQDLTTKIYHINYGDGQLLSESASIALSGAGQIHFDTRANALIITDIESNLESAFRLLRELDKRTPEVQMEIRFVEYNTEDAFKIGFTDLGLDFSIENVSNFSATFLPLNATSDAGLQLGGLRGPSGPAYTSLGSSNFSFEALTTLASSEIIQSPSILTMDNTEAEIRIGETIRFAASQTTVENGVTTTSLAEAESSPVDDGITIKTTPHITADGFVSIELEADDEFNEFRTFSVANETIELPQTNRKNLKTTIMVKDGDTAVIGGLLSNRVQEDERKIPLLGDIPVLGFFFRHNSEQVQQRNLTIFVTPRIVELSDRDELESAKIRLRERISGLKLQEDEEGAESNSFTSY